VNPTSGISLSYVPIYVTFYFSQQQKTSSVYGLQLMVESGTE